MTLTELTLRQAGPDLTEAEAIVQSLVNEGLCRPDEADSVLDTKLEAEAARKELGELLTGHKSRSLRTRSRRKPEVPKPDYQGLKGQWKSYYVEKLLWCSLPGRKQNTGSRP